MNITRVSAATLAGAITMFLLGFLVFGLLLANYFKEQTITYDKLMKDPPDMIPPFCLMWHLRGSLPLSLILGQVSGLLFRA